MYHLDTKYCLVLSFFIIYVLPLVGQNKYNHQWVLDHYNLMDFRNDSLILSTAPHLINNGSGDQCTSICDENGALIFYSGGCHIINKLGEIMENGDSINSDYAYTDFCGFGDFPIRQSNTIIPYPLNDDKFIYFNLDINIIEDILPAPLHLYYSVIDMSQNDGLGSVIEKNKIVISDTLSRGYLQAVQHFNETDWWIIVPEWNSNCYFLAKVTPDAIVLEEKQCMGGIWGNLDGGGQSAFSPDGTKYARIGGQASLYIFAFNDETGILSNPIELTYPFEVESHRGISFSPNSRYLYVSASLDLFQFDLESSNIQESILLVKHINPEDVFPGVGPLAIQQLAANGKVYIASPGSHKYLSVINQPNCRGEDSEFELWSIELPDYNYSGLPNLPHFNISALNMDCDTITSSGDDYNTSHIQIYPNPAINNLFIECSEELQKYCIYNAMGIPLIQGNISSKYFEIDLSNFNNGIYFIKLGNEINSFEYIHRFVKIQH